LDALLVAAPRGAAERLVNAHTEDGEAKNEANGGAGGCPTSEGK